ncbi:hypothetical protein [Streptomyces sp. NPDC004232]|uniref:hypothetical protein n=1 Tax=unclassified Streptomyces TaxID=2593676 RepID=UPI001D67A395|nr:hypothetical protein [Streptomyces sp. tea 10]
MLGSADTKHIASAGARLFGDHLAGAVAQAITDAMVERGLAGRGRYHGAGAGL